jgi:hypothetical protein
VRKVEQQLRMRLKNVEKQLEETRTKLEDERAKFRTHFAQRFRWWIQLVGENQTPNLPGLIESDAKFLHTVESWWW